MTLAFVVCFFSHSSFQKIFFLSVLLSCVRADISHSSLDLWQKKPEDAARADLLLCEAGACSILHYQQIMQTCGEFVIVLLKIVSVAGEKKGREKIRQDILTKSAQRILYLHIK